MRIGVAATPEVALPTLNWLLASEHEIALVISQPDRVAGRGRELKSSVVSKWAHEHGLPLVQPDSPNDLVAVIENLDCVLTIGYGVLLPEFILKIPRYGFINLHFSLLPAYRGAAPVQRAIEHGEKSTGVTVFALDKGMDTGPIYSSAQISIDPDWRAQELFEALALMAPGVVDCALKAISRGESPVPQLGESSRAPKISKDEAKIDWMQDRDTILRKIKAFYPAPISWSTWRGESFRIASATAHPAMGAPGQLSIVDGIVTVGCGLGGSIALGRVIAAGKKEMSAKDWARGAKLEIGSHLG